MDIFKNIDKQAWNQDMDIFRTMDTQTWNQDHENRTT